MCKQAPDHSSVVFCECSEHFLPIFTKEPNVLDYLDLRLDIYRIEVYVICAYTHTLYQYLVTNELDKPVILLHIPQLL